MLEAIESAVAAFGLTIKGLVAGAIGAFISLRFFDGLKISERWMTFVGGWAIASYGGTPLAIMLQLGPKADLFVTLLLGLFGMSVAGQGIRLIRETDWKAALPWNRGDKSK